MRGGALFKGKEGRGDFRKNSFFNGKEGRVGFRKRATKLHPLKVAYDRGMGAFRPYICYFLYFSLQKKCQVRNNGSQSASAG